MLKVLNVCILNCYIMLNTFWTPAVSEGVLCNYLCPSYCSSVCSFVGKWFVFQYLSPLLLFFYFFMKFVHSIGKKVELDFCNKIVGSHKLGKNTI